MTQPIFATPPGDMTVDARINGPDDVATHSARVMDAQLETLAAPLPSAAPEYETTEDLTDSDRRATTVAVVGLGYVGLPTALGLHEAGFAVRGLDISTDRLAAIARHDVDLVPSDAERLTRALASDGFTTSADPASIAAADIVMICVPTPLDRHLTPDLRALHGACAAAVEHARPGQTIVLTSTSYAGTTRQLLIEPLRDKGMRIGTDIFVAFSPERIDPGVPQHTQRATPRVVGGETVACTQRTVALLEQLTDSVHTVSSPEAAEMTKLYENTFRAVTLALANEFSEICGALALDPIEVTQAAATKPYGFMALYPGPGVGGHCIPCDPHYLLWQLRKERRSAPVIEQAMSAIAGRPRVVVDRVNAVLSDAGLGMRDARILVLGVSYKPDVQDLRESSALEIIAELAERGASVDYHDPLIGELSLADGRRLTSHPTPQDAEWDLVLVHTLHRGHDFGWVAGAPRVLDATYRFDAVPHRVVV